MKCRTRIYYTDKQKAFMWERWKQGDSYGTSLIDILDETRSNNTIIKVSGNNALELLLNMLNRGRIDATIADCNVYAKTARRLEINNVFEVHLTGFVSEMYIGIHKKRKDAEAIINSFDAALLRMSMDGSLQKLAKKYGISNWQP